MSAMERLDLERKRRGQFGLASMLAVVTGMAVLGSLCAAWPVTEHLGPGTKVQGTTTLTYTEMTLTRRPTFGEMAARGAIASLGLATILGISRLAWSRMSDKMSAKKMAGKAQKSTSPGAP